MNGMDICEFEHALFLHFLNYLIKDLITKLGELSHHQCNLMSNASILNTL